MKSYIEYENLNVFRKYALLHKKVKVSKFSKIIKILLE